MTVQPPPPPTGVSGIKTVPLTSTPYTTQGMISPVNAFVDPATGMLMPVSFRFLYGLFSAITALQAQNAALQQRLTNAGVP